MAVLRRCADQGMEEAQDKQKEYKEIEHRWNVKAAEDEQEDQGNSIAVNGCEWSYLAVQCCM